MTESFPPEPTLSNNEEEVYDSSTVIPTMTDITVSSSSAAPIPTNSDDTDDDSSVSSTSKDEATPSSSAAPKPTKSKKTDEEVTATKSKTIPSSSPTAGYTNGGNNSSGSDNTSYYAAGGAVAAGLGAAAGVLYVRRGKTAAAEIIDPFSNNAAMNPVYEGNYLTNSGQELIENPLYNNMDAGIDDGFNPSGSQVLA
jgi:hypothetical protein